MDMDTMTVGDVISALTAIAKEYGSDTPAVMLPQENDEPITITSVNVGYYEMGRPVASFTSEE